MASAGTTPLRTGRRLPEVDPLRWLWRGLTSVRFALALIGFLALSSFLGVLIPQVPSPMRDNPVAVSAWLALQRERFGFLTTPMDRAGLFDIFRTYWFTGGLGLLVASVCVCTANRFSPIWRNVFHPQTRVPDEYFDRGGQTVAFPAPDIDALSRELKRRRYHVRTTSDANTTYLFADRYPWSQFATFVSHLALILFLAGGFVTILTARDQDILIGEGETLPVFAITDKDHMQIQVEDAVGRFDETGFPLDYRTSLAVYRDGREVARGVTTVNSPLRYGGYKFHQTAYFPDGAALKVREVASGRLVYDEVLALTSQATTPRIVVRDGAGTVVLDAVIVPTDFLGEIAGTQVAVPGSGREFWIGARPSTSSDGWQLVVFETARPSGARAILAEGQKQDLGGLSLTFLGMTSIPSAVVRVPGAETDGVAELSRGPNGPMLTVGPVQGQALALSPGQPVRADDYEYVFEGTREFAGITVRRDPGSSLIWVATGTFLLGLALTFYMPRRRLWARIAGGEAAFRGLGGRAIAIEREVTEAAHEAARHP
ncbi:MAG TPA: cytochrome c biogenesis protein ResB [Dehalococcoidia bacterium]|nr:cytochrome c biogenesis protein ResB [Dehalococcoidia bacterium]